MLDIQEEINKDNHLSMHSLVGYNFLNHGTCPSSKNSIISKSGNCYSFESDTEFHKHVGLIYVEDICISEYSKNYNKIADVYKKDVVNNLYKEYMLERIRNAKI